MKSEIMLKLIIYSKALGYTIALDYIVYNYRIETISLLVVQ